MSVVTEETMQADFKGVEAHLRTRYPKFLARTAFVDLAKPDAEERVNLWLESNRLPLTDLYGEKKAGQIIDDYKDTLKNKGDAQVYSYKAYDTGFSLIAVNSAQIPEIFHADPKKNLRLVMTREVGALLCKEAGYEERDPEETTIPSRFVTAPEQAKTGHVANYFAVAENIATGHLTQQDAIDMAARQERRTKKPGMSYAALRANQALVTAVSSWKDTHIEGKLGTEVIAFAESTDAKIHAAFAASDEGEDTQVDLPPVSPSLSRSSPTGRGGR